MEPLLSVRELQESDIGLIADYWTNSSDEHMESMGVDLAKVPDKQDFIDMLEYQLSLPIEKRNAYCIIWLLDGVPVGHCNTNPTEFGKEANMHLHIWSSENRKKQFGMSFLRMTIPLFFENLNLKRLICEPYALNPAPNKTLEKFGFAFEKEYVTIPGGINFEQPVNRWVLERKNL